MITIEDIVVQAGHRTLLNRVSIRLQPGTVTAVLGQNGAGKTTLLRALSGDLPLQAGRICIQGRSIDGIPRRIMARMRAVLSQHQAMAFGLCVADIVALGRLPHRGSEAALDDHLALAAVKEQFGLGPFWNSSYPDLSGGERQRVQVARMAAQLWRPTGSHDGQALFLDEPTAALDLQQQRHVLTFARDVAQGGGTVLCVLHDPNQALIAHQAVLLQHGCVMAAGAVDDIMNAANIGACLGAKVEQVTRSNGGSGFLMDTLDV